MNIINFSIDKWYLLSIEINWAIVTVIMISVCIIAKLLKLNLKKFSQKSIVIEEVTLGIGDSSVTL